MQYASETDIILYEICSGLGIIFCALLIFGHLWTKAFRKPPGPLIVWQLIGILMYHALILAFALYNVNEKQINHPLCVIFAMLWSYAWFINAFYLFFLSYEINKRVRDPLDVTYSKRAPLYHGVSQITSIVITLIGLSVDAYGENPYHTCFIKADSYFGNVMFIPGLLSLGSLYLIIKALRTMDHRSQYMWRYVVFCLFDLWLTCYGVIMATVMSIIDSSHRVEQAFIFVISIGYTFLVLWRFLEVAWLKNYFRKQYNNKEDNTSLPLISSSPQQNFLIENYVEGIYDSMRALSYVFEQLHKREVLPSECPPSKIHISSESFALRDSWIVVQEPIHNRLSMSTSPRSSLKVITVSEYSPEIFEQIRKMDGVSCGNLSEILQPESNINQVLENAQNKGGQGGSFFYYTPDGRYIIKSLKKGEKQVLLGKFLQDYYRNLKKSLLSRIYGIFKIKVGSRNGTSVMVMGSIVPPEATVIGKFDIKGSKSGRRTSIRKNIKSVSKLDPKKVYKDQDFQNIVGQIIIPNGEAIKEQIEKDCQLLIKHNLMDYSLLITFIQPNDAIDSQFLFSDEKYYYTIGIIDYLQEYTICKKIERASKAITHSPQDVSVMNPKNYAERFQDTID